MNVFVSFAHSPQAFLIFPSPYTCFYLPLKMRIFLATPQDNIVAGHLVHARRT